MARNNQLTLIHHASCEGQRKSYQMLHANVFLNQQTQIVLVTSAVSGEGKTSIVMNLAKTIGQTNKSVLVIEANYYTPSMQGFFKQEGFQAGLSSFILGQTKFGASLYKDPTLGFEILFAGPKPSHSHVLCSDQKVDHLMKALRTKYDIVLVDTPALSVSKDAVTLAHCVDGVLYVISQDKVTREQVVSSLSLLENQNVKILGAVLNKTKRW